ncbi:MAG: class I SAM-dependent methyltransferase [Chloroflexi bacterium]|nr:class I SAM-dependent methyltransferase [Chloroflexota bacterium]
MRNIPGSKIGRVLDVCCGSGRHSNYLAAHGYKVVGIDLDKAALEKARREATGTVMYLQKDMRRLEDLPGTFDAVICMWQSFGYFDAIVNRDVLRQMSEVLRENGRLILDIYNRHFFEQNQGSYQIERKGISITATNTMHGNRLTAHLAYANEDKPDIFNWQLFTPIEIKQMAAELGLQCIVACTECDEQKPPTANKPRMMLVFEKQLGD